MTVETIHVLESKTEYRNQLIEQISLDNQEALKVSFENVIFRNVIISDSTLEQFEFTDVVLKIVIFPTSISQVLSCTEPHGPTANLSARIFPAAECKTFNLLSVWGLFQF